MIIKSTKNILMIFGTALLFLFGCAGLSVRGGLTNGNLVHLVKKIQPSIVTVVTYDINGNATGFGSGFFIDNQGHLITNHHVLKGAYSADVKTYNGITYSIEQVVADNEDADLIKVRLASPRPTFKWVNITGVEPSIGERVLVAGSPLGLEQTVSEGIVSAVRELPIIGKVFQVSAPISPGSSGSPVVNMKGKVVGVVSFQATRGQNINFAVSSKSVLDLKPNDVPKTLSEWTYEITRKTPGLVEELCKKGFSFSIRGEFKEALNYYREATEKSPNDTEAWFGLGSCYVGLDRPEAAISAYKQAIQTDPQNASAYYNLGHYYNSLGRAEEAIVTYMAAISRDHDHAPSYFDLGLLYGKLEDYESGEAAFKEVLRINPRHAPSYFYIGLVNSRRGHFEAAIRAYREALNIEPDMPPAHYQMGIAFGHLGKSEDEIDSYKAAMRIDPDYAPAHYKMGIIYFNGGNKAAALEEFKILKVLDIDLAERLFEIIYK